jgi:FkbM family methyltransferase
MRYNIVKRVKILGWVKKDLQMGNFRIFNRPPVMLRKVLFDPRQWLGLLRIFVVTKKPITFLMIYLTLSNSRMDSTNFEIKYRHRGKTQSIFVRGPHDYCTFFEVFCRRDYAVKKPGIVVVDIGSNIGISARFFLENGAKFIYLYEPDRENLEYLRKNITNFPQRYALESKAVSISSGSNSFEFENTGRYGRLVDDVNLDDGIARNTTEVEVIGISDVLASVFFDHNNLDILKIDIEGLEVEMVKAIPPNLLAKIKMIQYETWPAGLVTLLPG